MDVSKKIGRLPSPVVDEALIISEMFGLNEMVSLQLLLSGEERLCDYPGLTRGLVAILLYYDGRKTLVDTLRTMILGRQGYTWTLEATPDVAVFITNFTEELVNEGIVTNILDLLSNLNWINEMTTLQKNMALGDPKHRYQVQELFRGIQQGLADCLFALAAQSGLRKSDTIKLIEQLSRVRLDQGNADGSLDEVTMSLLHALLYALDISRTSKDSSIDTPFRDNNGQFGCTLPILNDSSFLPSIHREIASSNSRQWHHDGIQSLVRFAWAMTLANMRSQTPTSSGFNVEQHQAVVDEDEVIFETSLEMGIFHWMSKCILINQKILKQEEFYVRRIHQILTDLIVFMPLKVKDLRNRADDAARNKMMHENEGIQYSVPLNGQHFEYFLHCINQLYLSTNESTSNLILDYWCPMDGGGGNIERYPSRQISLYKFLRLAGDLLVPALYTPYVQMLTSISNHPEAALHCFNLLKMNGLGSGGMSVNGGVNTISWDHFFSSLQQYFNNLRQESYNQHHPYQDTIYRVAPVARQMTKGISPSEIQGLAAVLRLISTVCENSDAARAAIVQSSEWQPLLVMIGLLGCAVPTVLKAELLKTLASLSKTADVAMQVWNGIIASSFISNEPDSSNHSAWTKCGFLMELESVESKNEEYPMTKALLQLLDVLTDNSYVMNSEENIQANSSQGNNSAQLSSSDKSVNKIFSLVVDELYLRLNSRAYKNQGEKWQISNACLKIMYKLLRDFEPAKSNLSLDKMAHPKAGFHLATCLLQPSELLRLLLLTLNEACSVIEKFINDIPGKTDIEEASLYVLQILRRTLDLQPTILKASREANTSNFIFSGLDKLLFGINPRTGKADHMTTIAKFVTFSWWLPHHAFHSIKLIHALSTPTNQNNLLSAFLMTDGLAKSILKGFTDVIEGDTESEINETSQKSSEYDTIEITVIKGSGGVQNSSFVEKVERETRLAAIQLIQNCVNYPGPSIAHFLLGFDLNNISGSTLKAPGTVGTIRSPLHAMLGLLQSHEMIGNSAASNVRSFLTRFPKTSEAITKLIYTLVSNHETTGPILRYLHSSDDFFMGQLSLLPIEGQCSRRKENRKHFSVESLRAQAWLLKSAAIELKGMCQTRLRSQLTQWIGLLLSPRSVVSSGEQGITLDDANLMQSGLDSDLNQLSHSSMARGMVTMTHQANRRQTQNRLLSILNLSIDFTENFASPPAWEIFDTEQVKEQLNKCRNVRVEGYNYTSPFHLINIKYLNDILRQELSTVSVNIGHNQKNMLKDEVNSILQYAVQLNYLEEEAETKKNILDGWRQVTEVILCCTPSDILPNTARQQILLEVLQTLLNKVSNPEGIIPELSNQVSGVVLLLLTTLRHTFDRQKGADKSDGNRDSFLPLLDVSKRSGTSKSVIYPSGLQVILKGLVTWITSSNATSQRVRVNLYGALLNYLRIGKEGRESFGAETIINEEERFDLAKLRKANIDVLSGFGDVLIDTICRDSVSGHDIRRILALGLLDQLISLDKKGTWMWYVSREGYLKHIIEMLASEDTELLKLLSLQASQPKILFTYESKMAFFTRLASTLSGAELLLESGLMVRLAEMKVFSARPESAFPLISQQEANNDNDANTMSTMDIFHQIFFPALRLCEALLACLGPQNLSAASHVRHFIKGNENIFRAILHPPTHESLNMAGLEELSLVTGVLSKCETLNERDFKNTNSVNVNGLFQLRQQMISLIHHLDLSEHMLRKVVKLVGGVTSEKRKQDAIEYLIKISCNLHMYVRQVSTKSQIDFDDKIVAGHKYLKDCQIIFSPSFLDTNGVNSYQQLSGRPISIGQILKAVEHLSIQFVKLHSSLSEGDKFNPSQDATARDSPNNTTVTMLSHLVRLTGASIESTTWIAWRHLEQFCNYGDAVEKSIGFQGMHDSLCNRYPKEALFAF